MRFHLWSRAVIGVNTFEKWLALGIEKGWCSREYCETHDGVPMTEYEADQFDEGYDPCLHIVRLGSPQFWDNGNGYSHPDGLDISDNEVQLSLLEPSD